MRDQPFVLPPPVFQALEALCRDSILASENSHAVRTRINEVLQRLRAQADEMYGHDTPEIMALVSLLNRTNPTLDCRIKPRVDPIKELEQANQLNVAQTSAAWCISEIWMAWGRVLVVKGQQFSDTGGGGSSSAPDPVGVMSQRIWDMWIDRYQPWVDIAKTKVFAGTNAANLVIRIVAEGYHPDYLAKSMSVSEEAIVKTLKRELNRFNDISSRAPKPSELAREGRLS